VIKTKRGSERAPSRAAQLERDGVVPDMPPCDADHLLEYLFDAGPVMFSGGTRVALSSNELVQWQRGTGISLDPWEFKLLRQLSRAYLAQSLAAEDSAEPAPFLTRTQVERGRAAIGRKVSGNLRAAVIAQNSKRKS
jgi:hypothetical protein